MALVIVCAVDYFHRHSSKQCSKFDGRIRRTCHRNFGHHWRNFNHFGVCIVQRIFCRLFKNTLLTEHCRTRDFHVLFPWCVHRIFMVQHLSSQSFYGRHRKFDLGRYHRRHCDFDKKRIVNTNLVWNFCSRKFVCNDTSRLF